MDGSLLPIHVVPTKEESCAVAMIHMTPALTQDR